MSQNCTHKNNYMQPRGNKPRSGNDSKTGNQHFYRFVMWQRLFESVTTEKICVARRTAYCYRQPSMQRISTIPYPSLLCKLIIRLQIDERIAIYGKLYQFHSFNQQSERHNPPIQVKIAEAISLHLRLMQNRSHKANII